MRNSIFLGLFGLVIAITSLVADKPDMSFAAIILVSASLICSSIEKAVEQITSHDAESTPDKSGMARPINPPKRR